MEPATFPERFTPTPAKYFFSASYAPGTRAPMAHSHREQEEAYLLIGGSGRVRLDDEIHELRQWDIVRVSPQTVRAFEAGDDGLEIIAIGSDRPEDGDGIPAPTAWIESP